MKWKCPQPRLWLGAQVMFLFPYSPDFNSLEKGWSKIKKHLRTQESLNFKGLNQAIDLVIDGRYD